MQVCKASLFCFSPDEGIIKITFCNKFQHIPHLIIYNVNLSLNLSLSLLIKKKNIEDLKKIYIVILIDVKVKS